MLKIMQSHYVATCSWILVLAFFFCLKSSFVNQFCLTLNSNLYLPVILVSKCERLHCMMSPEAILVPFYKERKLGKKLRGKEWGKVKPKFGKKISIPLFPVSSDTGAFQGSFTNNYTMFFFPLIDYISTLRSIPFKCKQLQHLTKLGP